MSFLRVIITVVIAATVLLYTPHSAFSQDRPSGEEVNQTENKNRPRLAGYFSVGGIMVNDNRSLNSQLAGYGYPEFNDLMLSFGAGGYGAITNRLILGAELYGHITGKGGSYQNRDVSLDSGYGFVNIGYLFELSPGVRAYPLAGIGAGRLSVAVGSEPADDFGDVLENPDRQAVLTQAGGLVNLGTGIEFDLGDKGAFAGIRAGYTLSLGNSGWRLNGDWQNGDSLSGSPDASLEGPYLHLLIGWSIW